MGGPSTPRDDRRHESAHRRRNPRASGTLAALARPHASPGDPGDLSRPHLLDLAIAIEADSRRWHDHTLTRGHDADKQAILEADGWRVLRLDWDQTLCRPAQTLARVRAALEAAPQRHSA